MPDEKTSRRGFLEIVLGGSALATLGSIVYPISKYLLPPEVAATDISQLKLDFTRDDIAAEKQKSKYFKYGRDLGIIFLTDSGELKALSAICTHLDCTVQHLPAQGILWCACHNGKYTEDGKNISGPPPRPLFPFQVNEVNGAIFVSKKGGA